MTEIYEVITEEEALARGLIGDMEPWMAELFPKQPLMFAHAPLDLHPFRYVGSVGSAQGLLVLCTVAKERDGKHWMHVSMSRRSRLPSYEDLRMVKDTFIGHDRVAVQVFPRAREHVNIHPYCLHLWACVDADAVPDFRHEGQI